MWMLALSRPSFAITTVTKPEATCVFKTNMNIQTDEVIEFHDVKILWGKKRATNFGGLIAHTLPDAFVAFEDFINQEHAWTIIEGTGKITFNEGSLFLVSKSSSFEIRAGGQLDVGVFESPTMLANAGELEFTSSKEMRFTCVRDVLNTGQIHLTSAGKAKFLFSNVMNHGLIEIQSSFGSSTLSFGDLLNHDQLSFVFSKPQEDNFVVNGIFENHGSISLSGTSGEGGFHQEQSIINDGLICLKHIRFEQTAEIMGNGCWILSEESHVELDGSQTFEADQKIVFTHPSAYIAVGGTSPTEAVFDVYGLSEGALLLISEFSIASASYDESLGIFKVTQNEGFLMKFQIGKGYDASKFYVNEYEVIYEGPQPPPRPIPMSCHCEKEV